MLRVLRAHRPNLWLPHESADTLRRLRGDGWRLAILTNGIPSVQATKIEALALAPMVDEVIYAEAVTRGGKPARAPFLEALSRLEVPAERCVVVGDDPVADVAGARAAGLRAIRLAQPHITVEPGADADIVIHAIEQLPRVAPGLLQMVNFDAA
jgi:putative hydrolase of the HAD superfamily